MKKLRLGDLILGTICGIVIMIGVVNIHNSDTFVPDSKIEKSN